MKNVSMWVDGEQIHWQSKQWQRAVGLHLFGYSTFCGSVNIRLGAPAL